LDNDPLDVLVFNHDPIDRGVLVSCRVLGVLGFVDNGEIDNKLIAVPDWSPKDKYKTLNDIESEHLKIFRQFFKIYKIDRKSSTEVGQWQGKPKAMKILEEAHQRWRRKGGDEKQYWKWVKRCREAKNES
jgi:inorganic pyrophosphatase